MVAGLKSKYYRDNRRNTRKLKVLIRTGGNKGTGNRWGTKHR